MLPNFVDDQKAVGCWISDTCKSPVLLLVVKIVCKSEQPMSEVLFSFYICLDLILLIPYFNLPKKLFAFVDVF